MFSQGNKLLSPSALSWAVLLSEKSVKAAYLCVRTCPCTYLCACVFVCVNMPYPAKANTISKNVRVSPRVCYRCIIQQTHEKLKLCTLFGVCVCVLVRGRKKKTALRCIFIKPNLPLKRKVLDPLFSRKKKIPLHNQTCDFCITLDSIKGFIFLCLAGISSNDPVSLKAQLFKDVSSIMALRSANSVTLENNLVPLPRSL